MTGIIVLLIIVLLGGGGVGGYFFFTQKALNDARQAVLDEVLKECGLAAALFHKGEFNSSREHAEKSIELINERRELEKTQEQIPEEELLAERAIGYYWVGRYHVRRYIELRRIPAPLLVQGTIRWTAEPPEPAKRAELLDLAKKALTTAQEFPTDGLKEWHKPCVEGLLAFLNKKYPEAERLLSDAAKDAECDPEVVLTLGHALFAQGKYSEAEARLVPLIMSGKLALIDGLNAAARAIHYQALQTQLSGKDPAPVFARALKLLGNLDNPLAFASRADLLADAATYVASQGRGQEAEEQMSQACRQAAAASPDTPELCISYGRALAILGARQMARGETALAEKNLTEGVKVLTAAAAKHALDADLVSRLGWCAAELIRYYHSRDKQDESAKTAEAALKFLDAALAKHGVDTIPGLHLGLARERVAALAASDPSEPLGKLADIASKHAQDEWPQAETAQAHFEAGERAVAEGGDAKKMFEGVLLFCDKALGIGPANVEAMLLRGRGRFQLGKLQARAGIDPTARFAEGVKDLEAAAGFNATVYEPPGELAAAHAALAQWKRRHQQDAQENDAAALKHAEAALKLNQEAAEVYLERARVYLGQGQTLQAQGQDPSDAYRKATSELSQAISFRKSYADAYAIRGEAAFSMAEISRSQGKDPVADYKRAIEDLGIALDYRPKMAAAFIMRGLSYLAIGEHEAGQGKDPTAHFKSAMGNFDRVAEFLPSLPDGFAYRAYCRVQQGLYLQNRAQDPAAEFEAAVADIDKAISIDAKHGDALFARGTVAIFKADGKILRGEDPSADLVAATADLSQAFDVNPRAAVLAQRALGWLKLAEYQRIMGQPNDDAISKSVSDAGEALGRDARLASALLVRAQARAMRGLAKSSRAEDPSEDVKGARDDADAALKLRPNSAEALLVLGISELAGAEHARSRAQDPLKGYAAAIAEFERSAKSNPNVMTARLWKTRAIVTRAHYKEVREKESIPDLDLALAEINEVITANGQLAQAYHLRGLALIRYGLAKRRRGAVPTESYEKGLADAEQAVGLNATDPYGYALRGLARYARGDWERFQGKDGNPYFKPAFEDCNKALQSSPSEPTALGVRGRIYYWAQEWAKALPDLKASAAGCLHHAEDLRGFISECEKRNK
jgi:hypothetical protein